MKRFAITALLIGVLSGCAGAAPSTPSPSAKPTSAAAATPTPIAAVAPSAAAPTASSATSAPSTAAPLQDLLTGGRYLFGSIGEAPSVTIEATGPDGWVGYPGWAAMDGPDPVRADAPNGIGMMFFTANGVYSDPCHWDVSGTMDAGTPGDVPVGPSVDDLVAALSANTFYTSSAATPVTIDGYSGQELELQLPDAPDYATCDKDDPNDSEGHVFVMSGPGLFAQGQANIWHLYILDVEGTRLITVILSYAGTPQADLDTAQNILDTLDINPG